MIWSIASGVIAGLGALALYALPKAQTRSAKITMAAAAAVCFTAAALLLPEGMK